MMDGMANHRAPSTPLVGRDHELGLLLALAGVTEPGARDVVLLGGDAGIGKTRLLRELGAAAGDAGHRVMAGHCLDLGDSALPYQPFAEAFAGLSDDDRDELAARFPAVGPLLPWPTPAPGPGVERAELFASVVAALDSLADAGPVLLVIEDAHWADASTRHLIRYVLAQQFRGAVHVVVSYRADDLHRRHPLREALAEWVRLPRVRRVELEPLADADVVDLVRARATAELAPDAMSAVVRRSGGNAFFVEELLDAGLADHRSALPETLADLLLVRLERLDDATRRLVRAASVTDGREGFGALAAAAGLTDDELDVALGSAVDHKVLRRTGDDYAFRHALLGEALRDDLLPGERRRIHAAFLEALTDDAPPATIARHALAAGRRETAFTATVQAAEAAGRVAGYDEAAQHYERALELIDAAPPGTDEIDLVIDAADALVTSGQLLRALGLLRDHLAALATDVHQDCHGRLLVAIGNTSYFANLDADAEQASVRATELVPEGATVLRGEVAALRARVLSNRRHDREAAEWGEQALQIGEQLRVDAIVFDAKATLTRIMARTGDGPGRTVEAFRELVAASRASGHVLGELRGLNQMAFVLFNEGRLDAAAEAFAEGMRRAAETGWSWGPYGFDGRFFGALIAYLRGQWDDAVALCDLEGGTPAEFEAYLAAVSLLVAAGRGETDQIERTLPHRAMWRLDEASAIHSTSALIELSAAAGDLAGARQHYDDLVELHRRSWESPEFPATIRLVALLVGRYADAVQVLDRGARQALVDQLPGLADDVDRAVAASPSLGPEGRAWQLRVGAEMARLRWLAGVEAEAEADAAPAAELVEAWRGVRAAFVELDDPYESARSAARLAEVLATSGGDAEASALVAEARRAAERLGARPLLAQLDLLLPRPARSDVDLTPREREVLQQVALGRSNGEIGSRLFISTKTVSVHVSNILAKLGAAGRTEAAAIARRRGLIDEG